MKYICFVLIFSKLSFFSYSQKPDPMIRLVKDFFMDMKQGKDVRKYLSQSYISDNGIINTDWQSDYYMVKRFELMHIDAMTIQVKIDHGKGMYCTQFEIQLVYEDNGKILKILPQNVFYEPRINNYIVVPWRKIIKMC